MTEPSSTGIGGDMFCLFYDAAAGKVSALNGSGRSGAKCTLETIRRDLGLADDEMGTIPSASVHAVTVPGAAAGWVDTIERFGSRALTMEQILAPAIALGESGFPVSELTADFVSHVCPGSDTVPRAAQWPSESSRSLTTYLLTGRHAGLSGKAPRRVFEPHRPTSPRC